MQYVIRYPRLALMAVALMLLCVSFPALGWPALFGWLFLIPIVAGTWVIRTRTVISTDGLTSRTLFGTRNVPWDQIAGIRIPKRGWVRADVIDGPELALAGVSYDRIPELVVASEGRIPDPFTRPKKATQKAS